MNSTNKLGSLPINLAQDIAGLQSDLAQASVSDAGISSQIAPPRSIESAPKDGTEILVWDWRMKAWVTVRWMVFRNSRGKREGFVLSPGGEQHEWAHNAIAWVPMPEPLA